MRFFLGVFVRARARRSRLPARAQTGFDRPGGDYARFTVPSGDPEVCSARCDRDARCRAWTFSYPGTAALGGSNLATCWLKNQVKPLVENRCCVSGVKGAALVEMRPGPVENAIDRIGGDYRNFEIPANQDVAGLQAGLRRREPLPRMVLRAAGLRRADGALLPQGQDHARRSGGRAACRAWCAEAQPVPPTVMRSISKVGWPTPTGTPWPFLPQVPTPVSSLSRCRPS